MRTREIADATLESTYYTTPSTTLIEIRDSASLLESKYNLSRKKGPAATNAMRLQLKAHRKIMDKFLAYIQQASGCDATKIETASLTVKRSGTASQLLGRVYGLKGKTSNMLGQLFIFVRVIIFKIIPVPKTLPPQIHFRKLELGLV